MHLICNSSFCVFSFLPSLWSKVRCGCAVIGPFLLFNTKIRSSLAYSRKKISLSVEAFAQMEQLQQLLNNQPLLDNSDWWQCIWGNTQFSPKRLICISLVMLKFPRLSSGYGNQVVITNTKFSFCFYSTIALALEIY